MISTKFEYFAPRSLEEAVALLSRYQDDAKILAGGHSLIPAMKLRLAQPQNLIDLGRIKGLSYIREEDNHIAIGAMTTHYELESSDALQQICPLLPECASHIGDVQVRNKGTIGGSLAHADPAGDWPAAIIALDAEMVVTSADGEKVIKAGDFFVDLLTTALFPGEILREIRVQKPAGRFGQAYRKMHHPASGFAVVGVAATIKLAADGTCESAAIGITGVASKAYRATTVENELIGKALDDQTVSNAAAHAADGIDANSDLYASSDYRMHLSRVYTKRAIQAAAARVV